MLMDIGGLEVKSHFIVKLVKMRSGCELSEVTEILRAVIERTSQSAAE